MNGDFDGSLNNTLLACAVREDGLPACSPILPTSATPMTPHLTAQEWRTHGTWSELHRIAEQFRRRLIERNTWTCRGFNCHDCVEHRGTLDQIISCDIDKNAEFPFTEDQFQFAWHMRPYLRRILDHAGYTSDI